MGRIMKIYPDPKGTVRKVDLLTSTKESSLHAVNQLLERSSDQNNSYERREPTCRENKTKTPTRRTMILKMFLKKQSITFCNQKFVIPYLPTVQQRKPLL